VSTLCRSGTIATRDRPHPALLLTAIAIVALRDRDGGHGWPWFAAWALAGGLFFFSFLTGLSIGLLLLPLVTGAVLFVATRAPHAAEGAGFLAGVGLVTVLVAVVTLGDEHTSAAAWAAIGTALTAAGIAVHALANRRRLST
jgi:hypothetical protein